MTRKEIEALDQAALVELTINLMIVLDHTDEGLIDALAAARVALNDADQEDYESGTVVIEESL